MSLPRRRDHAIRSASPNPSLRQKCTRMIVRRESQDLTNDPPASAGPCGRPLSSGRQGAEKLTTVAARSPLTRLLQLILVLQDGRYPNAGALAQWCGVSRRTIYRDLEALQD